ncbi:23S rRNA (guanosine(2251)-2'-O)-methyltransferase RlmB [Parasulfuritortus cantonensis]|uniref:23S rRNA (guanosine-2'-O-)-methyltransferase RlmB n=1 Tax=Parasulfuritortus cantonensis TaxID=2528202 RepID=A0A4R1BKT5_9PROT|nr:23S rRNA (guanosine(2251)-2'-O)-methyltransferase RlmB [Parasulfuritortus cantonensis]TCJ17949.1 23S rRNA (guanosine(2251)-2'-O)-methyltransferase RlmB [Parasulfuritortus cantonensis]
MSQRSLIYGFHAVLSRLRHHPGSVQVIYLDEARRDKRAQEARRLAEEKGVKLVASEASRLEEMAHGKSQGIVAFAEPIQLARTLDEVLEDLTEPALLLVLDGVTDPHNLGACLRSADAFGAHAVIVPKDRAASLNATAMKAASGAADAVPFIPVTNLARALRELKERGILIVGTDLEASIAVADADFSGPAALVLGAEGTGMRRLTREHCDVLVRIPMYGQVESLNVSVSAGVCLYEARRQRAGLEA